MFATEENHGPVPPNLSSSWRTSKASESHSQPHIIPVRSASCDHSHLLASLLLDEASELIRELLVLSAVLRRINLMARSLAELLLNGVDGYENGQPHAGRAEVGDGIPLSR